MMNGPLRSSRNNIEKHMRTLKMLTVFILGLFFALPEFAYSKEDGKEDVSISKGDLILTFKADTRTLELIDKHEGLILSAGIFSAAGGDKTRASNSFDFIPDVNTTNQQKMNLNFAGIGVTAEMISDTEILFYADAINKESVFFSARAPLSERTMGAVLQHQQQTDKNTLVQTMGREDVPGLTSIYDPTKDLAIEIKSPDLAEWAKNYQWEFSAAAGPGELICSLTLHRHYYRDVLGVTYFAPIKKRSYFQKAPALAMTWVGIEGKFNRPKFSQRKEWLYPNIDWVSEKLLPYSEEMIFQLDDNYPIDDPQYMRDISDYIRSKGLIPGIWIAPFGVAPYSDAELHPEWFIHKEDGSPITTFSGLSYDDFRHYNSAVLNVNSHEGVEEWFAGFLRQVNNEWNYDYYKVDGIPAILNVYKQSVDGGGVEGVRRGLQIFREVVGPDKYINTCWGLPIEVIDIANGSRVGGDTEQENQVVSSVAVVQNYLNNVAWYSDPDGAANMYASTPARARLNFQGRAILGQPYVTDDNWTKVPDEILFVWQRTLPTFESFPTNLYKIRDPNLYDHFDLKIKRDWGEWDIVSQNNFENKPRRMILDLSRLPLSSDSVYVYDFWNQSYLGKHHSEATIERNLEAIDAQCYSMVPVQNDRPVLISTSRHFTQGGIDLKALETTKSEDGQIVKIEGSSNHLIENDPYDLVFVSNGYDLGDSNVEGGNIESVNKENGILRIRIVPKQKEVEWILIFKPGNEEISPVVLELPELPPFRQNIAEQAKASASSVYFWGDQNGYGRPVGANDGRTFRAWEAAEGETSGWLELIWEKPVTFNRIVIDEWQESGGEIQSWELEAGHKKYQYTPRGESEAIITYNPDKEILSVIDRGNTIGRNFVIELDRPVTANVLKLNVLKASERPGVWEIRVE